MYCELDVDKTDVNVSNDVAAFSTCDLLVCHEMNDEAIINLPV